MHSMIVAEPLGTCVGIACGEISSFGAKKFVKKCGFSDSTAEFISTATGHYLGAITTKAVINVALVDPIGAGINPASSAITAVGHGAMKAYAKPIVKKMFEQMFKLAPIT